MTERSIVAGLSISLTGKFRMQGRDAFDGLLLWQQYVNEKGGIRIPGRRRSVPVTLVHYDDQSKIDQAKENTRRLLLDDEVDLLFGPYSSGLTRAVAAIAERRKKLVWNHGGSSDTIFERGFRFVLGVSSPASSYFRGLPAFLQEEKTNCNRLAVIERPRSPFSSQVASGLKKEALRKGLQVCELSYDSRKDNVAAVIEKLLDARADAVALATTFQDDVAFLQEKTLFSPPVRILAGVAAGVNEFARAMHSRSDGVIGPSQWEPGVEYENIAGPDWRWFVSHFQTQFKTMPDYTAAQAFASGIVLEKCVERAGELADAALREAAADLDFHTFYGHFRIDPTSGRQVGHEMLLTRWQDHTRRVIWPRAE